MTYEQAKEILTNSTISIGRTNGKELFAQAEIKAIEALEKQIPEKPHKHHYSKIVKKGVCPRCLQTEDDSANYCRACGQHLDWRN